MNLLKSHEVRYIEDRRRSKEFFMGDNIYDIYESGEVVGWINLKDARKKTWVVSPANKNQDKTKVIWK